MPSTFGVKYYAQRNAGKVIFVLSLIKLVTRLHNALDWTELPRQALFDYHNNELVKPYRNLELVIKLLNIQFSLNLVVSNALIK